MKPSKNALLGYTYQEQITFLFLAIMDVERTFNSLELEADVDNNFDDIRIFKDEEDIYFQIKDIEGISLNDLKISENIILIKGKEHSLSDNTKNILVFKHIDINPNFNFFGLPALKLDNIYIISLSRTEIDSLINGLYMANEKRKIEMNGFFLHCLDKRIFKINRDDLPIIKVFDTKLLEPSIDVGKKHLEFSNLLFIEGKPGIGKSHYVNTLSKIYKTPIIYRFWISEQDKDKNARLEYKNFLADISKKVFDDYKYRDKSDIIGKIKANKSVVIIDGLDHVENYNEIELEYFIQFIDDLSMECKTIVLSRPLKFKIGWDKQLLSNWNEKNTHKVLNELYHVTDYGICNEIYKLTNGYPILVRFISEHYKRFNNLPSIEKLKDVEDYYGQIIKDINTKSALTLFLTSRAFFMKSELDLFLSDELLDCINEFIDAYPYLFEIRLNRISLFHDSFNKYLRDLGINYSTRKKKVCDIVYESIFNGEKRFMSRFSYFDLDNNMKLNIIKKYSSMEVFKKIVKNCIDFEALRTFYVQIRESLIFISPTDLKIINYYDLSLITNIVIRDQVSTLNGFLYTYSQSLLFHGYTTDDITSSEHLFGMFTYIIENDPIILYNITSDSLYDTTYFLEQLEDDIYKEESFFKKHKKRLNLKKHIDDYLKDDFHWREYLTDILTNLYIHKTSDESLLNLLNCINTFIDSDEKEGLKVLERMFYEKGLERRYPQWVLSDVKKNLLALGKLPKINPYLNLTLKDYILDYCSIGSFDMWVNILSFLRLSLVRKNKMDISSIGFFWCMYYRRKDYTVINMDVALKVFEENGLIYEETAIRKIVFTQNMSEKGIRHLLTDYISTHPPGIVEKVVGIFELDDLNISWFNLPSEHISQFPEKVFNYAVSKLLEYNRFRKEVEFKDISNVFYSKKWLELLENLKFLRYRIRISEKSQELKKLEKYHITIITYKEDEDKVDSSDIRYRNGMLDSRDIAYIIEKKLDVKMVSGHLNGNYSALSDLDVYKIYPKREVTKNLKTIFYNAILGRVNSINMFGSLFYFVGNLPKLVNDYDKNPNIGELYNSFSTFLELSLLNNNDKVG